MKGDEQGRREGKEGPVGRPEGKVRVECCEDQGRRRTKRIRVTVYTCGVFTACG